MLSLNPTINVAPHIAAAAAAVDKATERLSSGLRINRASDDAAGLSIAETMRAQTMGSNQATQNIQDAINVVQIGEDGVGGLLPIMQRIRELIVEAGNTDKTPTDLQAIQDEIDSIKNQIPDAFATAHQFNVDLSANPSQRMLTFQVGANAGDTETVDYNSLHDSLESFTLQSFGYTELYNSNYQAQLQGLFGTPLPAPSDPAPPPFPAGTTFDQAFPKKLIVNPNTPDNMSASFDIVDAGHDGLVQAATMLGAKHNALLSELNNVSNYAINIDAAQSQIRDADMASEQINLSKAQITQQATTALFGQANTKPETILRLLQQETGSGK